MLTKRCSLIHEDFRFVLIFLLSLFGIGTLVSGQQQVAEEEFFEMSTQKAPGHCTILNLERRQRS